MSWRGNRRSSGCYSAVPFFGYGSDMWVVGGCVSARVTTILGIRYT